MSLFIKERGETWNHMHTVLQTSVCSRKTAAIPTGIALIDEQKELHIHCLNW